MKAAPAVKKKALIVGIAVMVGLLHFVTGPDYSGPYPVFVNGYLIDIVLPLAAYFLLCTSDHPIVSRWWVKGLLVFGFGCGVETAQYVDIQLLGATFDPLDIAMYGAGVGLAIVLDTLVLPRVLPFWAGTAPEN
jgi:hypothetical protein